MARRGENIYRRKDARWEGRYISGRRPDGRPIFTSVYGKHYQEVKQKLAVCRSAHPNPPAVLHRFDEELELYLQYKVGPFVKPSTYAHYRQMARNILLPAFGEIPLNAIDPLCIQRFICETMARYSPSTLRNVFGLLRSVLRNASIEGRMSSRSWENARLPPLRRSNIRVLTPSEQQMLECAARDAGRFEFILFLYTGLRLGELCALRKEDIDCQNKLIHVRSSQYRVQMDQYTIRDIGTVKTEDSFRDIPLPPDLIPEIERYLAQSPSESPFMFPGRRGRCVDSRTIQLRLTRMTSRIGLEGVHVHSLRHTYATRLLEQGVGIETVGILLGHASPSITLRYYAHSTKEHCFSSVALLHPSK